MKKLLQGLLVFFLLSTLSSHRVFAQRGAFMAYGSLNYQHDNKSGTQFSANPIGLGYFFNDHVVAGVNYGFNRIENSASVKLNNQHEAGLFYSDSWSLAKGFVVIAQLDTHYLWGTTLGLNDQQNKYNGYLARIYPIMAISLGQGWSLKAKFAEISFQSTKQKHSDEGRNNHFVAGVNGSTLGIGVSKNFFLFKK